MRWIPPAVALLLACVGCTGSETPRGDSVPALPDTAAVSEPPEPAAPIDTNVVTVTGPTVLAAFPLTEAEAGRSAAMGEALENFQRHLDGVRDSLQAHGVAVHERYGASVHWRFGDTTTTRQVPPERPIYILLSPTEGERFVLGVQTDSALFDLARRHFRLPGGSP